MRSPTEKGVTLAELFAERIRGWFGGASKTQEAPAGPALPKDLFNPLDFRLGGYVRVETPELINATFSVEQISEFTRRIGKKAHKSVDYSLHDPQGKGEDGLWRTIRVIPEGKGKNLCVLMVPHFERGFTKELAAALKKNSITDDETGVTYRKHGEYDATIREYSEDGENRLSLKYWDFINEEGPEPRLYIVEMDQSDKEGWVQAYLGTLIPTEDVKPISGHAS